MTVKAQLYLFSKQKANSLPVNNFSGVLKENHLEFVEGNIISEIQGECEKVFKVMARAFEETSKDDNLYLTMSITSSE